MRLLPQTTAKVSDELDQANKSLARGNFESTTTTQHKMNCNQLLPTVIDDRARSDPHGAFTKVPILNNYDNGYQVVTNVNLTTAVDYVAGLIDSEFGQSIDHECIAYLGLSDLRYIIVLLAGIKTGFKLFFPSPRNSEEAQLSLLEGLSCSKLITTDPNPAGTPLIERVMTDKLTIPSLDVLISLDPSQVTQWSYRKSFDQTRDDPIFVLHTSGSTGIPKPLTYTHEYISQVWHVQTLEPPEGFTSVDELVRKGSYLVSLPPFHIAGFTLAIIFPAMYGCVPVYPVAGIPPTLNSFLDALRSTSFDWTFLSPVVIDEIGRDPKTLEYIAQKLDYLLFSGGSVPQDTGSIVARKMTLLQSLGSSECSAIPLIHSKSTWRTEDWAYLQLHPEANAEFQHRFDDCYELVHLRRQDEDAHGVGERFQPVFSMFPGTDSFQTKDLFVKHPTSPGLFRHVGRLDDIIVFLNGEKTNPVTFEAEVAKHPKVCAALLVGQLREEASLLVEPTDLDMPEQAKRGLIEDIWPTIEDSNKRCPKHAKVSKARVLIASKDMPFLRAVKGTVQRQSTLTLYKDIISRFYAEDIPEVQSPWMNTLQQPQTNSEDEVTTALREIAQGLNTHVVSDDINFFAVGIDSLQVIQFRRALVTRFPLLPITARTIYSNPTVKSLAAAIKNSLAQDLAPPTPVDEVANVLHSIQSKIDEMLLQESNPIKDNAVSNVVSSSVDGNGSGEAQALRFPIANSVFQENGSVLLTGSTGALGSHLLNLLLENSSRRIVCLNRSTDSRTLQVTRNEGRGLPTTFSDDRVIFLSGNLASPNFGLSASEFEDLRDSVALVIHSAWPVNFNNSLQSYTETLDGVLGLVRFAHHSNRKVKLQLVSSIASVARYSQAPGVPETVISDTKVPSSTGYGQSKYIAERILAYASEKLAISTISARVGQITGDASRKRSWNVQEWFPSLVISSLHMRALPDALGKADNNENLRWVSVESAAKILLEMSDSQTSADANTTFHILHPESSFWSAIIHTVKGILDFLTRERGGPPIEVIPYSDWLAKLKTAAGVDSTDAPAVTANPAVKLLSFFENLSSGDDFKSPFDLGQSLAASSTLRTLPPPLSKDCLQAWIEDWIKEAGI
jgi:thioester reductase-like protein/acyl-CoA synthetase (AMP-forming)/AMP-acid ligase II